MGGGSLQGRLGGLGRGLGRQRSRSWRRGFVSWVCREQVGGSRRTLPTPGGPGAWMSSNPWQRRVNWVVAGLLGALLRPLGCGVLSWSLRSADRLQGSRIPASGDQFPLSDEPGKFRAGIVPRTVWAPCRHQLGLSQATTHLILHRT